jgi:transposase
MGYTFRFCSAGGVDAVESEEPLRFVVRLLDGEAMTEVCREFGISRKTGYKIFDRYKEHGLEALSDRRCATDPADSLDRRV